MKRIMFTLVAIASVAASCTKLPFWEQPGNIRVIAHVQSIEQMSLVWETNDRLCVFDSLGRAVSLSLESSGKSMGTYYTYDWTEGAPAFATFPQHEGATCNPADSLISVHLPFEQSAVDMQLCPEFAAVGVPSGSRNVYKMVPMQNVMGMIKVQIEKNTVSKMVVASNRDGEEIAGTAMVDYRKFVKGETGFWTPVEGKGASSVIMTPVGGSKAASVSDGCFVPGYYYVSVLPGVYSQGLNVSMLDKDGNEVDKVVVPGQIRVPINGVFDIDDIMPDEITLELDFTVSNPLGTFPTRANQLATGNDYTFTYNFEFNGTPQTSDFTFTLYKGLQGYLYAQNGGVSVLHIINPGSTAGKNQCCIKFPAVPYRYLKSVLVTHRGKSGARRFRLQEGYPTAGHYYTLLLTDNADNDTDQTVNVATGSINIPTGTSDTKMIQSTKKNTHYYLQFITNDEYFIEKIAVTYSKTLE